MRPTAQVSATLGDLAGTTPASGTARYYATDHLGSTRSAWDASKSSVGAYEFTPYGGEYNHTGAASDSLAGAYTGKPWDDTAQLFHFPYRQYSPDIARWTTRDPLGMDDGPNVFGYVKGNPTLFVDPFGLLRYICFDTNGDGELDRCYTKKNGKPTDCEEKECRKTFLKAQAQCVSKHQTPTPLAACLTKARVKYYKCIGTIGFWDWGKKKK